MSSPEKHPIISLYLPNVLEEIEEVTISTVERENDYLLGIVLPPHFLAMYEKHVGVDADSIPLQDIARHDPELCYDKLGSFCLKLAPKVFGLEVSDCEDPHGIGKDDLNTTREQAVELVQQAFVDREIHDVEVMIWSALRPQAMEIPLPIAGFTV